MSTLRKPRQVLLVAGLLMGFTALPNQGLAKGLDQLSEENPASQQPQQPADSPTATPTTPSATEGASSGGATEAAAATTETKVAAPVEPSAASKAIAQKLFLATGFSWVKATKSKGDWKSSGMSDLTIGYKVLPIGERMGLFATYRYAPIAVSGQEEKHSYRGIWESHNLGTRLNYQVNSSLMAIGTFELGYVKEHLYSTDGLEKVKSHETSGAALLVGGGADWSFGEKFAFTAGPRLIGGVGTFKTVQVGAAASYLF